MSLEKCFFMSFACFSKGFFYIDCMDCFYMMNINPFICLVICKYLVSFHWPCANFIYGVLGTDIFNFDVMNSILYLCYHL